MKRLIFLFAIFTSILSFSQKKDTKDDAKNGNSETSNMALLSKKLNMKDVVTVADSLPQFPGGIEVFQRKFADAIETLDLKYNEVLDTRIFFIVEKSGYVNNVTALGKNKKHNIEAEKGVRRIFARWKPATVAGKPVRYLYSFPLSTKKY